MSEHAEDEKSVTSQDTAETEEATENSEVAEGQETISDEDDMTAVTKEKNALRVATLTLYVTMILIGVSMGASIPSSTHAMPEWYHILLGTVLIFGILKFLTRDTDFEGLAKFHAPIVVPGAFVASSLTVLVTGSVQVASVISLVSGLLLLTIALVVCVIVFALCGRQNKTIRECEKMLKGK